MKLSDAQAEIDRLRAKLAEQDRKLAWSDGRRGDGAERAPGFTVSETRVLRILASRGFVHYESIEALQRHMSNIRKKIPQGVKITTVVEQGYRLDSGKANLETLLMGHALEQPLLLAAPATSVPAIEYAPSLAIPKVRKAANPFLTSFAKHTERKRISASQITAIFNSIRKAIVPDASSVAMAV